MKKLKDIPKNKEQAINDFINGATDEQIKVEKNITQGSELDNNINNNNGSEQDNKQLPTQDTTQYTNKYTIEIPQNTELYDERLVSNVTRTQKKYVKEMAKKKKINESEFVRFMIDYFRNNVDIK